MEKNRLYLKLEITKNTFFNIIKPIIRENILDKTINNLADEYTEYYGKITKQGFKIYCWNENMKGFKFGLIVSAFIIDKKNYIEIIGKYKIPIFLKIIILLPIIITILVFYNFIKDALYIKISLLVLIIIALLIISLFSYICVYLNKIYSIKKFEKFFNNIFENYIIK